MTSAHHPISDSDPLVPANVDGDDSSTVYSYPEFLAVDRLNFDFDRLAISHDYNDRILASPSFFASGKGPGLPITSISPLKTAFSPRRKEFSRLRPLVCPADSVGEKPDMPLETAPGSPPGLTNSKSSKSSSYHSSTVGDVVGSPDISHFEDISLDDLHHNLPSDFYNSAGSLDVRRSSADKRSRPQHAASPPTNSNARMHPARSLCDLNGGQSTGRQPKGRQERDTTKSKPAFLNPASLNPATARSAGRKGLGSPRSATTGMLGPGHGIRGRSPSPFNPHTARSVSQSSARSRLSASPARSVSARSGTWAQPRKSAKEIEAEYDSDEDVPDDAFIWNVPLSPRPPVDRTGSRSPDKPRPMMPHDFKRTNSQTKHSSAPALLSESPTSFSPMSSRPSSLSRQSSRADSIDSNGLPRPRTKSWSAAMCDLSEEAKVLTEHLEMHADEADRNLHQGKNVRSKSAKKELRKSPSTVELPPVQKGNIMIDPLPISKEKEKVLTRTRPSWLPPKDPKEEKKHLREYQRMMALSQEAEKRRASKQQEEEKHRDSTKGSVSHIWDTHVIPNWSKVIGEPQIRQLWWLGLPEKRRGELWERAIGNDLGLTEKSFKAALERGRSLEGKLSKYTPEERVKVKEWTWCEAIQRDAANTYPDLHLFQKGGPMHQALMDVLLAYSMYRSDVGYVYGTHLMAALLLLNLPTPRAFVTLANLFNRPLPMAFLVHDPGAMSRAHDLVLRTLKYKIPKLHEHLTKTLRLSADEYLDPMFRTLFCNRMSPDATSRIWDVYVFEGDKALVRAAVGILSRLEGRLYGSRDEVLDLLGWNSTPTWNLGHEDEFMKAVRAAGKADS